jgi:hypothetical protein
MKVFPDYEKVRRKILFVGKETYGWIDTMQNSEYLTVDYLMESYEEFCFAKNYSSRGSPFWRFVNKLHENVNGPEFPTGLLWTNFSKCDSRGTTPGHDLQRANDIGFSMIKDEIKIINPDVVVFITGWSYEYQFQRVFQGLQYATIEENYIYKCNHVDLPNKTFMTMHPNALNFRKKFYSTLATIIEHCN